MLLSHEPYFNVWMSRIVCGEAPATAAQPKPSVDKEALKQDPKYSKFFKMLSVSVPPGSVHNKMAAEGMSEADINIFRLANGDPSAKAASPADKPQLLVVDKEALKQDPKFSKYFKMLSVGVPASSVYGKMISDGLSADDVNTFKAANGEAVEVGGGAGGKRASISGSLKPAVPLLKIHWDSFQADSVSQNSVWASPRIHQKLGADDLKELSTLFAAQPSKTTPVSIVHRINGDSV